MKNKTLYILLSAAAFSGLFYEQEPGINFLIFALMLCVLLILHFPSKIKDGRWWLYASAPLITAFAIFTVNSGLSVFAFMVSVLALCSKTTAPHNSIMANGVFSLISIFRSPFDLASETKVYYNSQPATDKSRVLKNLAGIFFALLLVVIFLFLYRSANPLFREFTGKLNFRWPDLSWFFFTLAGFVLLYGLLNTKKTEPIAQYDLNLLQDPVSTAASMHSRNSILPIATGLFIVLNLMLLIINGLDIVNIHISKKLPEGVTLSDFVHQAVQSLIATLLIGSALIAWLFQSGDGSSQAMKWLRRLSYAWIIQSALVVSNTMIRNYWYTQEYQLTHLRIGVFIFLALSLSGLFYTVLKIKKNKSAWWFAAVNGETWFFVLVLFPLFNWDQIITAYNLNRSSKPDISYLLQLSDANLGQLTSLHNAGKLNREEKIIFYKKTLKAYKHNRFQQWQSFNLRMHRNNQALTELRLK